MWEINFAFPKDEDILSHFFYFSRAFFVKENPSSLLPDAQTKNEHIHIKINNLIDYEHVEVSVN